MLCAEIAVSEEAPDCGLYTYKAQMVRVVNGDTVVADIDLGFSIWLRGEHLRLLGAEAPERRTPEGPAATDALKARVLKRELIVCTTPMKRSNAEARGSFGRYLVTIYDQGQDVNQWLIAKGFAVPFGN